MNQRRPPRRFVQSARLAALAVGWVTACLLDPSAPAKLLAADTFQSPRGYTISYPTDWAPIHQANLNELNAEVTDWLRDTAFDPQSVDVLILGPPAEQFRANVNVVTTTGELPSAPSNWRRLPRACCRRFATWGARPSWPELRSWTCRTVAPSNLTTVCGIP